MMDEGCKNLLFGKKNEGMCKTFLEGKGMPWEEKYKAVTKRFLNTFVFLTMNTLPKNLRKEGHRKETKDEWIEYLSQPGAEGGSKGLVIDFDEIS